jgi:hypothetical protein
MVEEYWSWAITRPGVAVDNYGSNTKERPKAVVGVQREARLQRSTTKGGKASDVVLHRFITEKFPLNNRTNKK